MREKTKKRVHRISFSLSYIKVVNKRLTIPETKYRIIVLVWIVLPVVKELWIMSQIQGKMVYRVVTDDYPKNQFSLKFVLGYNIKLYREFREVDIVKDGEEEKKYGKKNIFFDPVKRTS